MSNTVKDFLNEVANPKAIPIKLAFLHQAVSAMGSLNTERTLSADKVPGIKMTLVPMGLFLDIPASHGKTALKAIVPHANVALAVIAD